MNFVLHIAFKKNFALRRRIGNLLFHDTVIEYNGIIFLKARCNLYISIHSYRITCLTILVQDTDFEHVLNAFALYGYLN